MGDSQMLSWIFALFLLLPSAERALEKKEPILTIYVYTAHDESGFISDDEQQRIDSVKDLEAAIRGYRGARLLSAAEDAMIRLEVLGRDREDSGKRVGVAIPNGAGGYSASSAPIETAVLRVRLTAGMHAEEITGRGRHYWSRAASDVADRLSKWVERNKALLRSK